VYLNADELMTSFDWMREKLERQNSWRYRSAIDKIFGVLIDNVHDLKIETLASELRKAKERPHLSDPNDIAPGDPGPGDDGTEGGIDWPDRERGFH
jgi:hypothetical protein